MLISNALRIPQISPKLLKLSLNSVSSILLHHWCMNFHSKIKGSGFTSYQMTNLTNLKD